MERRVFAGSRSRGETTLRTQADRISIPLPLATITLSATATTCPRELGGRDGGGGGAAVARGGREGSRTEGRPGRSGAPKVRCVLRARCAAN